MPQKGERILVKNTTKEDWEEMIVKGRGGKAGKGNKSKNLMYFNLRPSDVPEEIPIETLNPRDCGKHLDILGWMFPGDVYKENDAHDASTNQITDMEEQSAKNTRINDRETGRDFRSFSTVSYLYEHDFVVGLQASGSHRVRPQIRLSQGNCGEVLFGG